MKKFLSFFLLILAVITVKAQTPPEAFNYSAVARDASGTPIANSTIGIQMSIKIGSSLGAMVYQENHFVNTDDFGLFNLIVGGGSVLNGSISGIDWSADDYYLQVGMDANGGTNFLTMGSTQLLSVPYALHAKTADSLVGGTTSFSGNYDDLANQPTTVDSISSAGDTLYLSNGQTFINCSNGGGNNGTIPTVTTTAAANITFNSAEVGGDVISSGGELVLARGICYATTNNPTVDDEITGTGTGSFTATLDVLQSGITYYARAYATNSAGTAYGNEVSFTTSTGILIKDFEDQQIISGGWTTQVIQGPHDWSTSNQGGGNSYYAVLSNFNGVGNDASEAWLISPSVNLSGVQSATLEFRNAYNYGGPTMQLYVSTDYVNQSAVGVASWTELSYTQSQGGFAFVTATVDLSNFISSNVHIAFRYTGSNQDGSTWQVDDIRVFQ